MMLKIRKGDRRTAPNNGQNPGIFGCWSTG